MWRNGLWLKFGARGKMWRVIRINEYSKSAGLVDGEQSEAFDVEQG